MPWRTPAQMVLAVMVALGTIEAQDSRSAVVVLVLADAGSYGQEEATFAALERAGATIVAGELALHPALLVVDSDAARRAGSDPSLLDPTRINSATAANLGRALGVDYVVLGTFIDLYGKVRIDARTVAVVDGSITHAATASGVPDGWFAMLQSIAYQIVDGLDLPPPAPRVARKVTTAALVSYGQGLLAEDAGDTSAAARWYRKAVEQSPGFTEAQAALRRNEGD